MLRTEKLSCIFEPSDINRRQKNAQTKKQLQTLYHPLKGHKEYNAKRGENLPLLLSYPLWPFYAHRGALCSGFPRVRGHKFGGMIMLKGLLFFIKFAWKHEKKYLVYLVLNQFISSMIPIVAVIMPRYIIDELMGGQSPTRLALYAAILAGCTFAATSLSCWLGWTCFTHRIKLSQDFNVFLHEKTVFADYADIESSRYLEMKEKAEKFLFGNLHGFGYVLDRAVAIVGKVFTLLGVAAVIAALNPALAAVFAALVLLSSKMEASVQRKQADMWLDMTLLERRTMYYGQLLEDFSYGKEIRLNNLGAWLLGRENEHWNRGYKMYVRSNALGIRSGVFNALTGFIQQAVSYAYLVARFLGGFITIGDFSMYVGGAAAFSTAMRGLMQNIVEVSEFRTYYGAIEEYLNIPAKMRDNKRLAIPDGPHALEFRNVSFAYPGQEGWALRNVNITLTPGQKLAVVGENGAGKTTFVKLLCRIYDPTEGAVLLDGVDIRDIDYERYTELISAVFQDYKLYSLSIKDNVALAQSDSASDEAVEAVLRKAGFGNKLDSLPQGVHTNVYRNYDGEGFEPSGGEGQKIALARALFKDAPIIVLDEPAAALDPRAEYEMYQNFDALARGKTAVYISHRLSSTRFCDRIAVFKNGSIAECGTHDGLLAKDGLYAELWSMQAGYYEK
jgi:ABC-type multidrug transport system fused ATPase/permease subunit